MVDLAPLQQAMTTATGLSSLVLVTPTNVGYQPQNPNLKNGQNQQLPPTFLFDIEDENKAVIDSDVTVHYVEDNSSITDNVALKPDIVTVVGFIGELSTVIPSELSALKIAADKLTILDGLLPEFSISAREAYNTAFQVYQAALNVANTVASWASINSKGGDVSSIENNQITFRPNQNRQQVAFQKFYGYQKTRTLFTIQTPWAIHKNMILKTMASSQGGDTSYLSSYELTFQQVRFVEDIVLRNTTGLNYRTDQFQGRLFNQASPIVDLGSSSPVQSSALSSILP